MIILQILTRLNFIGGDNVKFIHLSDLHLHIDPNDNVQVTKTLNDINAKYPTHKVIITGDIVDDGHEEQYTNAFEALKPFLGRIFICPGNHDFGAKGNFYSQERAERFDVKLSIPLRQGGTFTGDATPVVNVVSDANDQVMLIALDTNIESYTPFDFACGEVGKSQLEALQTILTDTSTANMTKVLFFHHHPFIHNDPFMELKDGRDLMRAIYQRVDVVLFGHKHVLGLWKNVGGIPYVIASDNSPVTKNIVREITIDKRAISVADIAV